MEGTMSLQSSLTCRGSRLAPLPRGSAVSLVPTASQPFLGMVTSAPEATGELEVAL